MFVSGGFPVSVKPLLFLEKQHQINKKLKFVSIFMSIFAKLQFPLNYFS